MKITYFWGPHCGPCRDVTPIVEQIAQAHGVELVKVNAEADMETAQRQNVRGLPTVLVVEGNTRVAEFHGGSAGMKLFEYMKERG